MGDCKVKYVGVMFEDKFNSSPTNPKFYGRVYNYKTTKDLKEGQVVEVETQYGKSKVCVIYEDVNPDEIDYPLDELREI